MTTTASFTEGTHPGEFVIHAGCMSMEAVTVASGQNLAAGAVLGKLTKRQAAAPIPTIVGTGTGLMSNLRFGRDVQVGSYVITLLATSGTAAFSVAVPDGTVLPNGAVGTAYKSSHLSFLISDGGTMTTGDSYTVVVTAGGTPTVVGGTGTGTISAISLGRTAKNGSYRVINRAVVANGGDFEVLDPDGLSCGRFLMGTGSGASASFASDQINFTLTDATDFIVGNYFEVIVATHTDQIKAFDPTAVDGTQDPWGVLLSPVDASSSALRGVAVARSAIVDSTLLSWGASVTSAQKASAIKWLRDSRNIIVR